MLKDRSTYDIMVLSKHLPILSKIKSNHFSKKRRNHINSDFREIDTGKPEVISKGNCLQYQLGVSAGRHRSICFRGVADPVQLCFAGTDRFPRKLNFYGFHVL